MVVEERKEKKKEEDTEREGSERKEKHLKSPAACLVIYLVFIFLPVNSSEYY